VDPAQAAPATGDEAPGEIVSESHAPDARVDFKTL